MTETSAPLNVVDDRIRVRANGTASWTVPAVLLTLTLGLAAALCYYRSSLKTLGTAEIVLLVLTALVCSLLTAYLAALGCGRGLMRLERSLEPLAANLAAIQETQVRLGDAARKTNQEGSARAALEEKNQQLLQALAGNVQAVSASATGLRTMVQEHMEATHTGITSLAASYGRLTAELQTLREASEKNAGGATDAVHQRVEAIQAALGGLTGGYDKLAGQLQALNESLQKTVGGVADVVRERTEATQAALGGLAGGHDKLAGQIQALSELTQRTAGGVVDVVRERAESIHAHVGGLVSSHDKLAGQVQGLNEQTQKTVGSVADVVRERAEMIRGALGGLAGGFDKLAGQIQGLNEQTQKTVGSVADVVRERTEATHAALGGLTGGYDKLAGQVQALNELSQKTAASVTDMVRERVEATQVALGGLAGQIQTLNESVQKTVSGVADVVRERAEAAHATIDGLAGGYDRLAGQIQGWNEQTQKTVGSVADVVRERAEAMQAALGGLTAGYDKLAGQVQGLNESNQKTVGSVADVVRERAEATHAALGGLAAGCDKVAAQVQALSELSQKTVGGVADVVRERAEATQAALGGLVNGCDKLAGQVQALQELSQKTAGSLTEAAREQTAAQDSLRDSTRALVAMTETLGQSQKILLAEIQKVAEAARQTSAAVTAATLGQTAVHETAKKTLAGVTGLGAAQDTLREAWRAHAGTTDTVLTALTAGQEKLTTDVQELHELTRGVADNVTGVAGEQTALRGALHDQAQMWTSAAQILEESQNTLHAQVEKAVHTAEEIVTAVGGLAVEQTTARETTRHMIGELASAAMAALTTGRLPDLREMRASQPAPTPVSGFAPAESAPAQPVEAASGRGRAATETAWFEAASAETAEASEPVRLSAAQAVRHGEQLRYETGPGRDNLGYWINPRDWAEWHLDLARPGRFQVRAEIAAVAAGRFQVTLGDQKLEAATPNTGDYGRFEKVELGVLEVPAAGPVTLAVRPIPESWQPMNLKSLDLVPIV